MTEWKVRYTDNRVHRIEADKYQVVGDNHVFESDGVDIAVIDRKRVESVTRADVADPDSRTPVIG